jgi:hypothetical protein
MTSKASSADRVFLPEACRRSTKASWAATRFSFSRTRWLFSFSRSAHFDMAIPSRTLSVIVPRLVQWCERQDGLSSANGPTLPPVRASNDRQTGTLRDQVLADRLAGRLRSVAHAELVLRFLEMRANGFFPETEQLGHFFGLLPHRNKP